MRGPLFQGKWKGADGYMDETNLIVLALLDETSFADRVGDNEATCSSTPGQKPIPTALTKTIVPDPTLNVVVM